MLLVVALEISPWPSALLIRWAFDLSGVRTNAQLAPRVPPGPWAVRVSVQDRTGSAIGASHLEVDGPHVIERNAPRIADSTEVHVTH